MHKITRRELLAAAMAGGAALTLGERVPVRAAARRKPNIIFVLADDLGYGDLGCYGQERIQTPHIDRMAAEGMRFTDCYAGCTVCAPSRSVLMTGLHTGHTRVRGNHGRDGDRVPLAPEDTTVAELLQQQGYATGLVGKWGLGDAGTTGHPNRKGFDYFYGYLDQRHAHNYYPEHLWRNEEEVQLPGNEEPAPFVHGGKGSYVPELLRDEALSFVDRHRETPFFLYWAMIRPHAANESGGHYGPETGEGMPVPTDAPYAEETWPEAQKNHAAMITQMDADVGLLFDKLETLGIAQDTLVIFTSDNGPHKEGGADPEFFGSRGGLRGIKRDLYEGGIRVPGIAWQPGTVPAGATSRLPWAFWDFLPTAAAAAGANVSADLDGISILPTLQGRFGDQRPHDNLYWEFHERGFAQAVRMGHWKAVRPGADAGIELYDLAQDVGEEHNLADKHPALVAEAQRLFEAERTTSEHWLTPAEEEAEKTEE